MKKSHGTLRCVCLAAVLSAGASFAVTPARGPRVGEVQKLTVITVSMQVGSTERETKRVTYTPPPGWYVRGHQVECKAKTGPSSFTVNTTPQDWAFVTEEQVKQSYRVLLDMAGQAKDAGLKARLAMEQEQMLREVSRGRSSHHALVVEACAKGEGFLRGGGSIELTVTAELVYVGTRESLERAVSQARGGAK
jgi:hypothetical protein